jgi:hypothetical protein
MLAGSYIKRGQNQVFSAKEIRPTGFAGRFLELKDQE